MPDPLVDGESVSYGPSQSRLTRTPILFEKGKGDVAGRYFPKGSTGPALSSLISLMPMLKRFQDKSQGAPGTISIYPGETNDVGETVRHESTHALMDNVYPIGKGDIPIDPGQMGKIAPFLKFLNPDQKNIEAPAYAAGNDPAVGLPQDVRSSFVNSLANTISKTSPQSAAIYKRLAGIE